MKPTIGRIVLYNTTEADREYFKDLHGNQAEQLPAIIVAVWGDACVNLKVLCDAECPDLWKTSAQLGTHEGSWEWPVKG